MDEPKQTFLQRKYRTPKSDEEIVAYIESGMEEYI
jgi:hypothetical protein